MLRDGMPPHERARKLKEEGNAALEKQDLALAYARYTQGLTISKAAGILQAADLIRDLSRNRAHVNLLLDQLDEAKSDALGSLIGFHDENSRLLDSKASFRAGCASYALSEYQQARSFFEAQLNLSPGNQYAAAYLRQIDIRIREQENGSYNLKKIWATLSRARPRDDARGFRPQCQDGREPWKRTRPVCSR